MASVSSIYFEDKYIMVAALDVGTSCSGYAFSYKTAKDDIKMNKNWQSSAGSQSYKMPTCILTEEGQQGDYITFGSEAQSTYIQSLIGEDSRAYDMYHEITWYKGNIILQFGEINYYHYQRCSKSSSVVKFKNCDTWDEYSVDKNIELNN